MPTDRKPAQAFEEGDAPHIDLTPVESNKIAAIGYHAPTQTLAVTFKNGNALYHYPDVTPERHAAFVAGHLGEGVPPSVGKHFIQHFQSAPFKKYRITAAVA